MTSAHKHYFFYQLDIIGFTKEAAGIIHDEFSKRGVISEPIEVDVSSTLNSFRDFSALLVGTPTWNTGAEEMRSGTTWDNILEEVRSENLQGKKVAVFGCGDSISYGDYFCDAIEEIHSAFAKSGAMMVGKVDTSGYDFIHSKSVQDGYFLGLALDQVNEGHLTEERVRSWCSQLIKEGVE